MQTLQRMSLLPMIVYYLLNTKTQTNRINGIFFITTLYIAIDKALAIASQDKNNWTVDLRLEGHYPQCIAADPLHPEQVYCGIFDQGLWRSADAGAWWMGCHSG
jgi:hypothetical protein